MLVASSSRLLLYLSLPCLYGATTNACGRRSRLLATHSESGTTCENTIAQVTQTLAQQCPATQCLKILQGGTDMNTIEDVDHSTGDVLPFPRFSIETGDATELNGDVPNSDKLGNPVMSFEDWKIVMLRRYAHNHHVANTDNLPFNTPPDNDGHLAPNVAGVSGSKNKEAVPDVHELSHHGDLGISGSWPEGTTDWSISEKVLYDDGKTQYYRSRDAGKTCKERFSYASFDAGATVLKTSPGAKNPKAILQENKDSYMLLECSAEKKYVIVELSDDILVDTIVLANFEFFSSMVRHFRVSVSDRYPVKMYKWRELGTFEARNSRDIQPFLVENPLIWAKYVRVEFLTHYGNEYYCPISLLRVHGTRMLESWKESEPDLDRGVDDINGEECGLGLLPECRPEKHVHGVGESGTSASMAGRDVSPVQPSLFPLSYNGPTCSATLSLSSTPTNIKAQEQRHPFQRLGSALEAEPQQTNFGRPALRTSTTGSPVNVDEPILDLDIGSPDATVFAASNLSINLAEASRATADQASVTLSTMATASPKLPETSLVVPKNKTSAGAVPSSTASPTVQESFFKSVSKRLQLMESNMTWTVKYVEDQTQTLQESLLRMEKRRLVKAEALLTSLNSTVMAELEELRQQYDLVWQSSIMALELLRDQSQREVVALSSRLNVLAEEVVFQKRMSIGQSILLLSCLVLIIFSRSTNGLMISPAPLLLPRRSRPDHSSAYPAERLKHNSKNQKLGTDYMSDPGCSYSSAVRPISPSTTPGPEQPTPEVQPDDIYGKPPASYGLSRRIGFSRKPLPALPEYPDSGDQV